MLHYKIQKEVNVQDTDLDYNSKYTSFFCEWNTNLGYFQGEIIVYPQQFNQDKI